MSVRCVWLGVVSKARAPRWQLHDLTYALGRAWCVVVRVASAQAFLNLAGYGSDSGSDSGSDESTSNDVGGGVVVHKVTAPSNLLVTYGEDDDVDVGDSEAGATHHTTAPVSARASLKLRASPSVPTSPPRFVASATFGGERRGYVFKLDGQGLGYYLDSRDVALAELQAQAGAHTSAPKAAAAADVVHSPRQPPSAEALAAIRSKFPLPLPVGEAEDSVAAAMEQRLQGLLELQPVQHAGPASVPHPDAVAMVRDLSQRHALPQEFNDGLRSKKAFGNPYALRQIVEHMDIDEVASNYPRALFDPHKHEEREHYTMLAARQTRFMQRKMEAAAAEAQQAEAAVQEAATKRRRIG